MPDFDKHSLCWLCREMKLGEDPCVKGLNCKICGSLSAEQHNLLLKPMSGTENSKKSSSKDFKESSAGAANDVTPTSSLTRSTSGDSPVISAMKSPFSTPNSTSNATGSVSKGNSGKMTKHHKSSSSDRIDGLEKSFAERFNRLEAMLLARSPEFSSITAPVTGGVTNISVSQQPFFPPPSSSASQNAATASTTASASSGGSTDETPAPAALTSSLFSATQPSTTPVAESTTDPGPASLQIASIQAASHPPMSVPTTTVMAASGPIASTSALPVGGKPSSQVHRPRFQSVAPPSLPDLPAFSQPSQEVQDEVMDTSETEDGQLSEFDEIENAQKMSDEQSYKENIRAVRQFMGWSEVPEFVPASSREDNPFLAEKPLGSGRLNIQLPVDEYLCRRMDAVNRTVATGYPTKASDTAGLARNRLVKNPSIGNWYGMWSASTEISTNKVTFWNPQAAKVNSSFPRITKAALANRIPSSLPIHQESLRRWEERVRRSTYISNQAAGFSRCLRKIQEGIATQMSVLKTDKPKDKITSEALEELQFLTSFNQAVTSSLARSVCDLTESLFVDLANITLIRRDSYLEQVKSGIKPDTLMGLRTAPVHLDSLFPDDLVQRAESEIATHEAKLQSSHRRDRQGHPYKPFGNSSGNFSTGAARPRQHKPGYGQKTSKVGRQQNKPPSSGKPAYYQKPAKGTQWHK